MQSLPEVLAFLLADAVSKDYATNKHTVRGVLNELVGSQFPLRIPTLAVYIALTDGYGKCTLNFKLQDSDEKRAPICSMEASINFANPLDRVEIAFGLHRLIFIEPGEYKLVLTVNGEFLKESRVRVRMMA